MYIIFNERKVEGGGMMPAESFFCSDLSRTGNQADRNWCCEVDDFGACRPCRERSAGGRLLHTLGSLFSPPMKPRPRSLGWCLNLKNFSLNSFLLKSWDVSMFPVTSAEVAQLKAGSWQSLELKCGTERERWQLEQEGTLDDHSTYQEEQLMAHDIFLYLYKDFIYIHVVMIDDQWLRINNDIWY